MRSAFGVDHDVSKRILPDRMPDSVAAVLPGTAVRSYDESPRKKKVKHATRNAAAKVGTGALVGLSTAAAIRMGLHKTPMPKKSLKLAGKKLVIDTKRAPIGTVVGGTVGGGAASYAGQKSYKNIKAENRRNR